MVFELVGSRIMGPYFGTSMFVWTSLIGVILGSLSLGYWWGGRIADKKPNLATFALIIFFSGATIGIIGYVKDAVFIFFEHAIRDIKWGSLLSSLVMFSIPSVLLGMISPFAVKLRLNNLSSSGTTIGTLYAVSTIGSIAGTFLAGFFLIPSFGSTSILFFLAILLITLSLIIVPKKLVKIKIFSILLCLVSYAALGPLHTHFEKQGITIRDTAYNSVRIYLATDPKTKQDIKLLKINNEFSSAMFLHSDELVFEYTKFYHLAEHFNPGFKKALMLGGAGYSYPKEFLKKFPESDLHVVEIDPTLTTLATKYFDLIPNKHLHIHHQDARVFINRTNEKYDVIYGDAFQSMSPPFQLTTQEAVKKYYSVLNNNGVILVNIISAIEGGQGEFARAELATFKTIFPQTYLFPITNPTEGNKVQNIMLVALKSPQIPSFKNKDNTLQTYLDNVWKKEIPNDIPLLTDDYAPVDFYLNKVLSKK